jgi:RNA polymerase primary sigma factor
MKELSTWHAGLGAEGDEEGPELPDPTEAASASSVAVAWVSGPHRLLTLEEEVRLAKRIERGDQGARHALAMANHRLVFGVVNHYRRCGIPVEDLVQEGMLGLFEAAGKFDCHYNCRFSTMATAWIRSYVLLAIHKLRPLVHVPQRAAIAIERVRRATEQLTHELHRSPHADELAQRLGLDLERVEELALVAQSWLSLDGPATEGGGALLHEILVDHRVEKPANEAQLSALRRQLDAAMQCLTEREQLVLRLRFGLDDGEERTLEEIGRRLGLTRQRVKQIERVALGKLRRGGEPQQRIVPEWATP